MVDEINRVVVVGAAGFGRESLDVLEAMQAGGADLEMMGVIDDNPSEVNLNRLAARGVPYLGTVDNWLSSSPSNIGFVLGVGNPSVRRRLAQRLENAGFSPFSAVHPKSVIGSESKLSAGVVICAGAVIDTNVQLGSHVHINKNVTIGHDVSVGDFVSVNPAAVIAGEVRIQDDVLVGATATVLQNLTVGERTIVGAAALVTKDVPNDVVVKGVPGVWNA
ncbi:acetyltransferase [Corynebacterium sp. YIM 101645]|uniref:Acetyltransferase n=1 Tax=Corynebacterium lemuris TaxID=1859292 RepID=A0ABT2FZZ1_9CORY|nr:acetyltransferase [Corynebacterium lemuris]MCS5480811.1 acetyltransferase [Corynebacterium lemuris]